MSRYGYLEVFNSPLEFEITRVDCTLKQAHNCTKHSYANEQMIVLMFPKQKLSLTDQVKRTKLRPTVSTSSSPTSSSLTVPTSSNFIL